MTKNITSNKLIETMVSIEEISAIEAGAIGFMSKALVQANMPHKKPISNEFVRINGNFRLSLISPKSIGLPYGSIPRLIMVWITTEAVCTKKRELVLGDSLSRFMKGLGYKVTGGNTGTINRFKDQMKRLFSTTITWMYSDNNVWTSDSFNTVCSSQLFWEPKISHQAIRWESKILLSESFYDGIIEKAVPFDMRALKALRGSPMALDIYFWLTYRMSYLCGRSQIPWEALQGQLGAEYNRLRDFKRAFTKKLLMVSLVYPQARFDIEDKVLIIRQSPTHVSKSVNKRSYPRINSRG